MKPIFYAYMITVLVFSACSSGKSTFEHGNYYEAVLTSVNRLRRNSDHKKSMETLRQAYPMAVAFFEDRAKTSLASAEPFKWGSVVDSYTAINTMYDDIKRCPGALAVIPNPVNYFSKLQEARQNAAEEQYAAGILALQAGDRENAKKAYTFFKAANTFSPGYKEVNSYLQAALDAATVKIVVEPIPVHSKAVGVSAEFFNDKISEYVHSVAISEFVKFYTREEAKKIKLNPNHIIQLAFDDFTVGQVTTSEKEIHLTKDSIVMATYITAANTNSQSGSPSPVQGNVVTTASPVASATVQPSLSTQQTVNADEQARAAQALAAKQAAERELAAQQLAEKQKAEREAADKARAAQELAERQQAEKQAAEKLLAEKQKAENEAAAKALAAQQLADKERAEKEAAAQALAEKQKAEKEAAEKALAAQQLADKEKADKEAAAKALAAQQLADKQRAEKEAAEKALAEKQQAEKEAAEKALAAQQLADKQRAEKEAAAKALEEKRKAEAEAAKRAEAEKEKAEKEKAEREKAEKEKAEKEKNNAAAYVDDTIKKEDTTDVKDPVTICHVPPGNQMKHHTLVISRSALQAHLRHGDSEGSCEGNEIEKGKPQDGGKGGELKKKDNDNGPADKKNGKGPSKEGTGSVDRKTDSHALLFNGTPVFIASLETGSASYLRYLETPADTNKVYGTVKATLYQYKKTTTSKGVVSFRIIDAKTGALLSAEKMPGEFVWVSEWATFNGDERALSPEQLQLTRLKEQPAPSTQDLFIEFTKPIYEQITAKIRDFYKNY